MSFILDALRKSESERQREAAPSLSRIPEAVAARRLPRWAAGTIALLGLGVVGLATALWLSAHGTVDETTAPTGLQTEATTSVPSPAVPEGSALTLAEQRSSASSPSAVAAREARSEAAGGAQADDERAAIGSAGVAHAGDESADPRRAAPRAAAADPSPAVQRRDGDRTPVLLPSYETAAATDASLPKLNLEFHAFADDPSRRFVYIDGEKYVEGSTLPQGPRVMRITAEGVVLEASGKQLLLSRK